MPRPDKPINPGRLDGEVSSSRSRTWTKYGSTETIGGHRSVPSEVVSGTIEIIVDDLTVVDRPDSLESKSASSDSKYTTRGTSAHSVAASDEVAASPAVIQREWVVDRSIEGRTYQRSDVYAVVDSSH